MTLFPSLLAASPVWNVIAGIVMGLFILTGFVLTVVVLLQEGKGGGIAGAFGGAGAEAFGVKAGTVNRFTAYVGTAFLALALIYAGIMSRIEQPTNPDQPSKLAPTDYMQPPPGGTVEVTPGDGTPPGTPPATPPEDAKPPEPVPAAPAPAPEQPKPPEQPKEPAPAPAMGG